MHLPVDKQTKEECPKDHLDWLDARLAECEGDQSPAPASFAVEPEPIQAASPTENTSGTAAVESAEPPAASPTETAAEAMLASYSDEQQGLSSGAKYGCIFAAAAFILLFLGILFVLPRFLYGDKDAKDAPPQDPPGMEDVR